MFKSISALLAAVAIICCVWLVAFKPAHIACSGAKWTTLESNQFNIFVDANLPQLQIKQAKEQLEIGKMRVENLFGITISNPKVILVNSQSMAEQFSLTSHGQALLNPLSQCIVLDVNG